MTLLLYLALYPLKVDIGQYIACVIQYDGSSVQIAKTDPERAQRDRTSSRLKCFGGCFSQILHAILQYVFSFTTFTTKTLGIYERVQNNIHTPYSRQQKNSALKPPSLYSKES